MHSEKEHVLIIFSTIIAALAIGAWRLHFSDAAVARRREEKQRELERLDHEYARKIAEMKSDLSRLKGWPGAGPGWG
jgi:hypothetical protein